jgi:hypothetical protein
MRLMELTDGLHGYLRFETELPTVEHNNADSAQAAFVQEATRYMRIYDVGSGRLLFQSDGFAPMGLHLTPEQVRANRAHLQPFDVPSRYGRVRISNSAIRDRRGREYLVQVGVSLNTMDNAPSRYRDCCCGCYLRRCSYRPQPHGGSRVLRPSTHHPGQRGPRSTCARWSGAPTRGVHDELDDVATAFPRRRRRLEHLSARCASSAPRSPASQRRSPPCAARSTRCARAAT